MKKDEIIEKPIAIHGNISLFYILSNIYFSLKRKNGIMKSNSIYKVFTLVSGADPKQLY